MTCGSGNIQDGAWELNWDLFWRHVNSRAFSLCLTTSRLAFGLWTSPAVDQTRDLLLVHRPQSHYQAWDFTIILPNWLRRHGIALFVYLSTRPWAATIFPLAQADAAAGLQIRGTAAAPAMDSGMWTQDQHCCFELSIHRAGLKVIFFILSLLSSMHLNCDRALAIYLN